MSVAAEIYPSSALSGNRCLETNEHNFHVLVSLAFHPICKVIPWSYIPRKATLRETPAIKILDVVYVVAFAHREASNIPLFLSAGKNVNTSNKYQVLSPLDVTEKKVLRVLLVVLKWGSTTHSRFHCKRTDSRLLQLQVDLIFPADWQFDESG